MWLLNWPPPSTTQLYSCCALPWASVVRARPTEAEGWQDAGTPAPNPDSLLQTFAREQLNVFPTSATHCPLLVVNVAHFIHPDGVHIPACELTEPRRTVARNGALEPGGTAMSSAISCHFGRTRRQGGAFKYKYLWLHSGLCISLGTPILLICAWPGFPSRRFSGEGDGRNSGGLIGTLIAPPAPRASAEGTRGLCGALR